ncbi:MAG: class I SAM-dependent methyltransferase [Deltaproteobacteria bacterium]|nr:class I SAM-dependent methyltransferase [Deltaproteobacteria bacterium]
MPNTGAARFRSFARTFERSLKTRGVSGSVRRCAAIVAERVARRRSEAHGEFAESDAAEGDDFDAAYGVSTRGEIAQADLDAEGDNWVHGSAYVPSSRIDFGAILADLDLRFEETSFVDLGAGKGRALLMAAALPFRAVTGVELAPSLASVARDNLARYTGPRASTNLSVVTGDATTYPLPSGDVVVFMYHPFDETIMARVEQKVSEAARDGSRRVLVVYFKPVHRDVWDRAPRFRIVRETPLYVIYDSRLHAS